MNDNALTEDEREAGTVIVTALGGKYHVRPHGSNLRHVEKWTEDEAILAGFDPCRECFNRRGEPREGA